MVFLAEATVFIIPVYLIYRWFQGVEGKKDGTYIFLGTVFSLLFAVLMGSIAGRPSPFQIYETVVSGAAENSFPSTHMTVMFGFLFSLFYRDSGRKFLWGFLVITIITAFARVYIGEHYPLDVLGSVLAGLGGLLVVKLSGFFDTFLEKILERLDSFENSIRNSLSK